MDRWLSAVEQDQSALPLAQKIVADKPADLSDACWDGVGQKLGNQLCGALVVPVFGTPRTVAGDAISTDTNKCQLKPLSRDDVYGAGRSEEHTSELQSLMRISYAVFCLKKKKTTKREGTEEDQK